MLYSTSINNVKTATRPQFHPALGRPLGRGHLSSWAITWLIALLLLCAGASHAAAPLAGFAINNRAEATYIPAGHQLPETLFSNTVTARVAAVESLLLTSDQVVNRSPGSPLALVHVLTNTGNVTSNYRFEINSLPGADFALQSLRLVHDLNGNGVADAGEPVLAQGAGSVLSLAPGRMASLILMGTLPSGGVAVNLRTLSSRLQLQALTTSSQPISSTVTDTVRSGLLAAVVLTQSADQTGQILPGVRVHYQVTASNIGDAPALASAQAAGAGPGLLIDGASATVFLLRDAVPAGMRYVAGSLTSSLPGAVKLFRLPGDPPLSYRRSGDDAAAVEVAIALPGYSLAPNVTVSMGLALTPLDGPSAMLTNRAEALFDDGSGAASSQSNALTFELQTQRLGLAERADLPQTERDPATQLPLSTALVRLSFVVQNFGREVARDVQVTDILAGAAGTFGRYTAAALPAAGEYTLVANSATSRSLRNGAQLILNPQFDGTPGASTLLAPGNSLPADGAAEISVLLRINVAGRDGRILNQSRASASLGLPARAWLTDDSVDGDVPDLNGDSDPTNDTSPTAIVLSVPRLELVKTASLPRRLVGTARRYEIDYALTVTNTGKGVATFVQVADNLTCTFVAGTVQEPVREWHLVAPPTTVHARLVVNPGYTGSAPCPVAPTLDGNPLQMMPSAAAVMLTDGSHHLEPGQSEEIRLTVGFELEPLAKLETRALRNVAIAALYDRREAAMGGLQNTAAASASLLAAAAASAGANQADPSGIVYNASTREPVAGARVTLRRDSCQGQPGAALTPADLAPMTPNPYQFQPDGGVTMTTAADGYYLFLLRTPPVTETCEYRLTLAAPANSGLHAPSKAIPVANGLAPGGAVQAQPGPPTGAEPTLYYTRMLLGPAEREVWNNHLPLDSATQSGYLVAEKTANRKTLEIGQSVDYTVRVRNVAGTDLSDLEISDRLPSGFHYVAGTSRLNGAPASDPLAVNGALVYRLAPLVLADQQTVVLSYRAVAGIATALGDAVNRVRARSGGHESNEAVSKVTVTGGVFSDEAFLFGKVYLDCNRDGVQDRGEVGIPGVRLLLEDGSGVVTDGEGKYSLYGLRAITHVLKLDMTSLPPGARLRQRGQDGDANDDSRFVDLRKGEWHKTNFAVDGCEAPALQEQVRHRREALAQRPDAEGEVVSRARLELQPSAAPTTEQIRGRAASGELRSAGAPDAKPTPLAQSTASKAQAQGVFDGLLAPQGVPGSDSSLPAPVDLQAQIATADNSLGFVDLRDGDTLASALSNVRVKGPLGAILRLTVNGRVESEQRVGKRLKDQDRGLEAWEYIGVGLTVGKNELVLQAIDGFGNVRGQSSVSLVAPGALARIEIEAPRSAVADPGTPVRVKVRLLDANGIPVTARTPLTLETDRGRWASKDLNPNEPGTQVFIESGTAEFALIAPNEPLNARLRISSGAMLGERDIAFLPELRPLIGSGVIEGVIDLRRRGAMPIGQTARDAFEQTLRNLSRENTDGSVQASARAAFYFKGTVRGDLLLTAAFDSDKDSRASLFRDIQPDKFYPIYGDSSVKTFDAQSTQRLYLRIDQKKSYLLYGDFSTAQEAGGAVSPRRLSQTNRSMTGVKAHHETDTVSASAYVSHDRLKQNVIEFPADGTSGPYAIAGSGELIVNSERVEVLVRERRQSGVILSTSALTRFTDYVIEPLTRRIMFAAPVSALDENLNERFIRITYETDTGGAAFWSGGAEVQLRVDDSLQLGASVARDGNLDNPATLLGTTAVKKLGERSTLVTELAHSDTSASGAGNAARLELRHESAAFKVQAQVVSADARFENADAGIAKGRTEGTAQASMALGEKTELRAEASYSADALTGAHSSSALLTVRSALAPGVDGELGLRAGAKQAGSQNTATPADQRSVAVATGDSENLSLRARLSLRPSFEKRLLSYVEAEADVKHPDARQLAVGGEYQVAEKTRLYGRYELLSGNEAPLGLTAAPNNVAVFGLETSLQDGGRVFNEYRLRDAISGREAQLASGVRSVWQVSDGLRLGGSYERTSAFGGTPGARSSAVTGSLEYTPDPRYKLQTGLQARVADSGNSYLSTAGLSVKINRDWSLLARNAISLQSQTSGGDNLVSRQQLGLAWRQVETDQWNGLARYEHLLTRTTGVPAASEEEAHIVSLHLNYQVAPAIALSGRYAFKTGIETRDAMVSAFRADMLFGRVNWDFAAGWDASLQGALHRDKAGGAQRALGVEVGHRLHDKIWLSLGFNVAGVSDPLLSGEDRLLAGAYLRLRYKFDEGLFK